MKGQHVLKSCMIALGLVSCTSSTDTDTSDDTGNIEKEEPSQKEEELSFIYDSRDPVIKVETDADIADITIGGLFGQSVYLMMMNVSSEETDIAQFYSGYKAASPSAGAADQAADSVSFSADSGFVSGHFKNDVTRYDYPAVVEFNNNPPVNISIARDVAPRSSDEIVATDDDVASLEVDSSTRDFWVEYNTEDVYGTDAEGNSAVTDNLVDDKDNDGTDGWLRLTATLRAQGVHANVWIVDEYYDNQSENDTDALITSKQAEKIAAAFDAVYYPETNIFGYEYGGGPGGDGGRDGEIRINILIYDLYFDATPDQSGGYVGYFWGKDYFSTEELSSLGYDYKSNYSEIFYIDSFFVDAYAGVAYSTLAHEYQHMIHFNEKIIKKDLASSSWFNEMLSLLTEDMTASYLEEALGDDYDADVEGPIASWIPYFNYYYWYYGVTDWDDTYGDTYATVYAFGAYLARNYGGAVFIKELASNAYVDEQSVTAALEALDCSETTFDEAFERYGEAVVYSSSAFSDGKVPASINTFDRTATSAVDNSENGENYEYIFDGFDIWKIANYGAGYEYYDGYHCPETGPTFIDTDLTSSLNGYGLMGQTGDFLKNISGSVSFSVTFPADRNVVLYLMIR